MLNGVHGAVSVCAQVSLAGEPSGSANTVFDHLDLKNNQRDLGGRIEI